MFDTQTRLTHFTADAIFPTKVMLSAMVDLFAADIPPDPGAAPPADAPLADRLRPRALEEVIGQ